MPKLQFVPPPKDIKKYTVQSISLKCSTTEKSHLKQTLTIKKLNRIKLVLTKNKIKYTIGKDVYKSNFIRKSSSISRYSYAL
jgi:hypothetical protein